MDTLPSEVMSTSSTIKMRGLRREEIIDERIHYMRLKASSLIDLRNKDYRESLIISGSARSGTTWLTELLNAKQEHRELFEPFSEMHSPIIKKFQTETFYSLDTENSGLHDEIAAVLLGNIHTPWIDRKHGDPRGRLRIVKDIRLGFALPWILEKFPTVRAVHLLRHPFAVYQSWCRLNFNYRRHLQRVFARNTALEYLCPIGQVRTLESDLAIFVLYWCLENFFAIKFSEMARCHISVYENFFIDRGTFLDGLQRFLPDLKIATNVNVQNFHGLSATSVAPSPALISYYHTKTLRENSDKAINEALAILKIFQFDALYSEDPFPKHDKRALLVQGIKDTEKRKSTSSHSASAWIPEIQLDPSNPAVLFGGVRCKEVVRSSITQKLLFFRAKIRGFTKHLKSLLVGKPLSVPKYTFLLYRRKLRRTRTWPINFDIARQHGLVSIILPVYNGEQYLRECLDSIFAQTHTDIEVIAVNDGSTDSTLEILKEYAHNHSNMHILSQENKKLPAALNTGMLRASGEFITWTSADNRLHPDFIQIFTNQLKRDRQLALVYGAYRLINTFGQPLKRYDRPIGYQSILRPDHVALPQDSLALNTARENTIGPTFMYRAKDAFLCGAYSSMRTGLEDLDFFRRINSLCKIRHSDTKRALTSYRIHDESMSTTMQREIKYATPQSEVFDEFRRDSFTARSIWIVESNQFCGLSIKLAEEISNVIHEKGDLVISKDDAQRLRLPIALVPIGEIFIDLKSANPKIRSTSEYFAAFVTNKLASPELTSIGVGVLSIGYGDIQSSSNKHDCYSSDVSSIVDIIFYRQRASMFTQWERALAFENRLREKSISVIICSYKREHLLAACLESVLLQTFSAEEYEVIVVNNSSSPEIHLIVEGVQNPRNIHVKIIDCPIVGLSNARNFGASAAVGKFLCFIDDDAVAANDWLHQTYRTFQNPSIGCVGGSILLQIPASAGLSEDVIYHFHGVFSHFEPEHSEVLTEPNIYRYPWGANFSISKEAFLATGGFRTSFGRRGQDYGGGEEVMMSANLNKLGYRIAIKRESIVFHFVEPHRFDKQHIYSTLLAGIHTRHALNQAGYGPPCRGLTKLLGLWIVSLVKRLYWTYGRDCEESKKIEAMSQFLTTTLSLRILIGDWYERYRFSRYRDISRI